MTRPRGGAADHQLHDEASWFIRLTDLTGRIAMRALTDVQLEGLDRPLPTTGPLLIASNHISNADAILISCWLTPALGRRVHWLGKEEAMSWPLIGWGLRNNGVFGVKRGAADVEAFRLAKRVLDEGHVLAVFPEGTRSPTAALQPAKDGLAILAFRTGSPILPVGIANTDRFWPRGRKLPKAGGHVTMRVGSPFSLPIQEGTGAARKAAHAAATALIMGRIAELLPPRHRGAYAELVPEGSAEGSAEEPVR